MYQELLRENARLREEVMWLRRERERLQDKLSGRERGVEIRYVRSLKKGQGAHYDVVRLGYQHRKILYGLLAMGATSQESGVPTIQIRRTLKVGQGPLSGRIGELIHKGYIACNKVGVLFQPDAEGSWSFRPETAYDPRIGARRYKRFCYHITPAGADALRREVRPSDDFVKTDLGALVELKKIVEDKEGVGRVQKTG